MMATELDNFQIRSSDLLRKERLDYGGFGQVFLCYHREIGHVVLKSVFTGSLRNEVSKRSLLEEGTLMKRLCHDRVVRLLGVVMEEGDYSLVMELLPKGNLQAMLKQVSVPISIKARITLEILEGMVYLTENKVVHKDLKPENILVDNDFHIKIADLGLATCQEWSKLTREESRRQSRQGAVAGPPGAGTLSYMAPEHLEDINTRSTEKSDVYSFAIVLWVILTGQHPYENAITERQVCMGVCIGHRPALDLIAEDAPVEMVRLMKSCWTQNPKQRPTFEEAYKEFLPFYKKNLEEFIEKDTLHLRDIYDGPEELVDMMKSLCIPPESESADGPTPLLSSVRLSPSGPVEASIEDLNYLSAKGPRDSIQTDASTVEGEAAALKHKLERELQYHKNGSYTCVGHPASGDSLEEHAPTRCKRSDQAERRPTEEPHSPMPSSVRLAPTDGLYRSNSYAATTAWSLNEQSRSYPGPSAFDRQNTLLAYPVPDTAAPEYFPGRCFTSNSMGALQDTGSKGLYIHNASAVQIGNYNSLRISGSDTSLDAPSSSMLHLKEVLTKYENQALTEKHLDLLRDNIGNNWKLCARRLGLTNMEVEAVDHDFSRDGLQEKVHQMLEKWRMKEGRLGCTVGKLVQALEGRIPLDVVKNLLYTCQNVPPASH